MLDSLRRFTTSMLGLGGLALAVARRVFWAFRPRPPELPARPPADRLPAQPALPGRARPQWLARRACRSRPSQRPHAAPGLSLEWQEVPAGPDEALAPAAGSDLWPTRHRPARPPSAGSTSARPGWRASTCSCCAPAGPLPGSRARRRQSASPPSASHVRLPAPSCYPRAQRRRLPGGPRRRSRTCARATWPPASSSRGWRSPCCATGRRSVRAVSLQAPLLPGSHRLRRRRVVRGGTAPRTASGRRSPAWPGTARSRWCSLATPSSA